MRFRRKQKKNSTNRMTSKITGRKYRSTFEMTVCDKLDINGIPYGYETDKVSYVSTHTYTPDVTLVNGILVELKGYFKPEDRSKHLEIKKQHPELDIRFVFQNPYVKLNSKSRTTYADWCDKHGFQWACVEIPEEWTSENR